jgi:predicted MFS family arabinose efflux permease
VAEVSWRLAFLVNGPIGVVMILLALTVLRETRRESMALDLAGAVLASAGCMAAVFAFTQGPEHGWSSALPVCSGLAALVFLGAFVVVERNAENPMVPFDLFTDRSRVATFAAIFLAGGVMFTLTVLIGLYVQDVMGYKALRAGLGFVPFALAMGVGLALSSYLVRLLSPRVLVIGGGLLLLTAMLYGSTLNAAIPYFPNLVAPIMVGVWASAWAWCP